MIYVFFGMTGLAGTGWINELPNTTFRADHSEFVSRPAGRSLTVLERENDFGY